MEFGPSTPAGSFFHDTIQGPKTVDGFRQYITAILEGELAHAVGMCHPTDAVPVELSKLETPVPVSEFFARMAAALPPPPEPTAAPAQPVAGPSRSTPVAGPSNVVVVAVRPKVLPKPNIPAHPLVTLKYSQNQKLNWAKWLTEAFSKSAYTLSLGVRD